MKASPLKPLTFASLLLIVLAGCDSSQKEQKNYDVGFRVFRTVDRSRIYKPGTDSTDYLHYRPLDIDVWYPAKASDADSAMVFRDLLGLLETRANYYTASHAGDGLTGQLAHYFCEGLKCSDTTRLLSFRTRSHENVAPIEEKFPLILYLSSYNGMGYENFSLFEALAERGFIVASINSIGRYPGDMTMKNEDMREQVYDAIASLQYLEQKEKIDFSNIGIVGYSWGGLSGSLVASKLPTATCLISLDGSEFHHYGQAKEEDRDFDEIMNSEDFVDMTLSIPYLRLESSPVIAPDKVDSVYDFTKKLSKDRLILRVDSARHADFSCLATVIRTSGACKNTQRFNTITRLTTGFLEKHLKRSSTFDHLLNQEMNVTVRKNK